MQLRQNLGITNTEPIQWLSPLEGDEYAEYRDKAFLERLGIGTINLDLTNFWPSRGPQWDALGKSKTTNKIFLVEAKAHIPELISTLQASNPDSISKILESLEKTKAAFGCKAEYDWTKLFYQYANRLAHANFLRQNNIAAYLVSVYFLNDSEMDGPRTAEEWKGAIRLVHRCLGLREHLLKGLVVDLFIRANVDW